MKPCRKSPSMWISLIYCPLGRQPSANVRCRGSDRRKERGTGPHVVSKILNHMLPGVGAVYMRADHQAAMRQALEKWGSYASSLA
jgi:hypothetical protein